MPTTDSNTILIGEAAKILKVSVKTLRRWEDRGLLTPNRNNQNQRVFTRSQINSLQHRKHKPLPHKENISPKLLSISEAATILGVSIKTIRRWDDAGKIESVRNVRNQRMFTHQALIYAQKLQTEISTVPISSQPAPTGTSAFPAHNFASFIAAIIFTIISTTVGLATIQSIFRPTPTDQANIYSSTQSPDSLPSITQLNTLDTPPESFNNPDLSPYIAPQPGNINLAGSIKPYQDLEIDAPMTFTDLNLALNQNADEPVIELVTESYNENTLPRVSNQLLYTHPVYSMYTLPVPMPQAETNPLSVIATSPTGRQILMYAEPVSSTSQWLIRFLPDELGSWRLHWYATSQSLEGNQVIVVVP
jgi:excisionase family DNA binding protein